MPYLKEITDYINTTLENGKLNDMRFKAHYAGISQTAISEGDEFPVIYDNKGQGVFRAFNDAYSIIIYHRVNEISYSEETKEGSFGDDTTQFTETATMKAVVWAKRDVVNLTQEQLAFLIVSGFPNEIPRTEIIKEGLSSKYVMVEAVNNNSLAVYNEEFKQSKIEYPIRPDHLYFSITYQIITNYSSACSEACAEC